MARRAGASGKTSALAQEARAPGGMDEAQAAEAQAEAPAEAGAGRADAAPTVEAATVAGAGAEAGGDPSGDPQPAEASALVEALRVSLLQRMTAMVQALPPGYYTEVKGMIAGADGAPLAATYKLRDFAASLKDLAAIGGGKGSGQDVEDWSPLAGILGDIDPEYDGDDDDGGD